MRDRVGVRVDSGDGDGGDDCASWFGHQLIYPFGKVEVSDPVHREQLHLDVKGSWLNFGGSGRMTTWKSSFRFPPRVGLLPSNLLHDLLEDCSIIVCLHGRG